MDGVFLFKILPGQPEEPRNVQITAVATTQLRIHWRVGLSGGSRLTFSVHYKAKGEMQEHFWETNIFNPGYGQEVNFLITDLEPDTKYEVYVRSINQLQLGQNWANSEIMTIKTRGKTFYYTVNYSMIILLTLA